METVHRVLKGHPGFMHVAIGQAGSFAIGAVFWFLMARILDPGAYGQVNWFVSIAMFASACCVLGWGTTITTYYPKERNDGLLCGATTLVLIASLLVGIAIGALIGPLVGLLIFGLSLFSITLSTELGKRSYRRYKWIQICAKLMVLPLTVWMYFWIGLLGVLIGYAVPFMIFGLSSLRYVRRTNPGMIEAREKFGFAVKAFGANIASSSTSWLDKILIGSFFGMAALGVYQLAYQIFMLLSMLPTILFSYLLPEKSAGTKTREVETLGVIAAVALSLSAAAVSPIIIPKVFPNFSGSVELIQVMSFGVVPFSIAAMKMSGLYAHEMPGAVLISYLIALAVGIAGIIVLGNYFGALGLAMSVVLLQTTLAASLIIFGRLR
ncbi:MAG: hypothetical protein APU95_02365 [Hadesarchaea archaeon YNP_N21]|nr:MAG: hypothetical protein APU95_02365 [Hadesarchaea archaeon YNP_N21]